MQTLNEPLVLVDIRGQLIRRYHVTPTNPINSDASGKEYATWQAALTGYLTYELPRLLELADPRRIICVWDSGSAFRTALYSGYKAARKAREGQNKLADEQIKQLETMFSKLSSYLGVKHVKVHGEEADDIIALFVERMPHRELLIITGDADLLQLTTGRPNVQVMMNSPNKGTSIYADIPGSLAETSYNGIPLSLIRLHKSIVGDSSDGYIGVSGIGAKGWDSLLESFGEDGLRQLESCVSSGDYTLLERAVAASNSPILSKLLSKRIEWSLSYTLAKLHPEVCYRAIPGKIITPEWRVRIPSRDKVEEILKTCYAEQLLDNYLDYFPQQRLLTANEHAELVSALTASLNSSAVGYDFESSDRVKHAAFREANESEDFVDTLSQELAGISFCYGSNYQHVVYASFDHADTANFPKNWAAYVLNTLSTHSAPVAHNAAFELAVAKVDVGVTSKPPYDTMIMSSYVEENEFAGLKDLSLRMLGYKQASYKEVTKGRPMYELTGEEVLSYGCDDSLATAHLFDLMRIIMELEGTWTFYDTYETLHIEDNVDSFIHGSRIDVALLSKYAEEDDVEKAQLERRVRQVLEEQCLTPEHNVRLQAATVLLEEWWAPAQASLMLGKTPPTPDQLQTKRGQLWEKAWATCAYVPYVVEKAVVEVLPTVSGLAKVTSTLELPVLDKVTKTGVSAWLMAAEDFLLTREEIANRVAAGQRLSELEALKAYQEEFCQLLGPACSEFAASRRSGPEYDAFMECCSRVMAARGPQGKEVATGDELNWKSTDQMQGLLYGKLGLPVRRRSKVNRGSLRDRAGLQGGPAVGNKAIASALVYDVLSTDDWRYGILKDYLKISRILQNGSLYYKPYPLWIHPRDGMIHPQIKNCGTVTRRPSGSSPNKLQVSKKDDAKIRKVYLPWADDHCICSIDFNGQELRLTASESKDPVMIDAYIGAQRKDLHSLTSSGIARYVMPRLGFPQFNSVMPYEEFVKLRKSEEFGKAANQVRDTYAKPVNFLIIYGGGAGTLAENLLIPKEFAEDIMAGTFSLYQRLQPWQQEVAYDARCRGYVTTAYGNRRHLTADIWSDDKGLRLRQERQAVNYLIQGVAADILKIVQTEMVRRRMRERYHLKGITPIYDEFMVSVPVAAVADYAMEMKEIMEVTPPGHAVPMEAELSIGIKSWGDKKEIKAYTHDGIKEFLEQNGALPC